MPKYRSGSRFEPTELGLVKVHLKDMVEKKISGFIKTLNVYGDAPWLLHHDTNPLYSRNEWYYFVPRTIRGVKTVSRMVPGNGEGFLGGTWKSIGKKKEIKRNEKELVGYKRVLVFNKNVVGGEVEKKKTASWHMDEYSLHRKGEEYHDLVLCHVRLLNSAMRFKPLVPAHQPVDENNDNNNNVVLPNQEEQEAGFAMLDQYEGGEVNQHQQQQEQEEEQEDSVIPLHPPLQSNHNYQRRGLLEDIVYQNDRGYLNQHQQQQQEQEDSHNLLHPSFQSNDNQRHYPLEGMAYHGAEGDMSGYGLMPMFNDVNRQHEQQQDSPTPVLPPLHESNDNQEHCPYEDYAFDGEDDNLTFDVNELLRSINEGKEQEDSPTLQSNVNQQQCHSWDTTLSVPCQVENKDNTVLPNQEQQEAGFANHNNDMAMVEKEHGGDIKQHQQQQDQEQQHKDLPSLTLIYGPEWADLAYSGDLIMQNMDVSLTQQQQEVEEELLQPVPQAQDSGVHDADQVMPPLQSNDNHGHRPLVPSQVENNDNNTVVPNQVQLEAGSGFNGAEDDSITHNPDGSLTQQQLQKLEIFIENLNLSF